MHTHTHTHTNLAYFQAVAAQLFLTELSSVYEAMHLGTHNCLDPKYMPTTKVLATFVSVCVLCVEMYMHVHVHARMLQTVHLDGQIFLDTKYVYAHHEVSIRHEVCMCPPPSMYMPTTKVLFTLSHVIYTYREHTHIHT
jgi:hypothetical protein